MKTVLVSFYFLFLSIVSFGQYATCALAGANPATIDMSTSCGSWTSNTFNLSTQGTSTTNFPSGDCVSPGSPTKDYWVSFIMPANTSAKFYIEYEIVGGCTPADLGALGATYIVGSCSGTTKNKVCNYCNATSCSKKIAANAAFTPGAQIYLQLYDNNNTNCDLRLHIYPSPAEDDCSTAKPLDETKNYCNKGASKTNEVISVSHTCTPRPPNKNAVTQIDNAMWFSFTVLPTDPQPYTLTMSNISCTGGQQSMQMLVYSTDCNCVSGGMEPCYKACTAQEEPATTTSLTIYPGAPLNSSYTLPAGDYYLVIDGGNGADCTWNLAKNIALPVSLLSFDLTKYKSSVKLNWEVLQEVENKGYTLQRSSDGQNFKDIGYVSGKGDYNGILKYEFIDYSPLKTINYYRIKQEDNDNKIHYSVIRATALDAEVTLYPNPVAEDFQLYVSDASKEYRYRIINANGQTIEEAKCGEDNFISLRNYSSGLYYIFVYNALGEIVLNQSLVKN